HALERLAHLVGDRPQPVQDDLVGQRVEAVDLLLADGMGGQRRGQRAAQLPGVDGPAREGLGTRDGHAHDALPAWVAVTWGSAVRLAAARAGRMARLPRRSTVAVVPP